MDLLTHFVSGGMLGQALPERFRGPRGPALVALGAVVPDADYVLLSFSSDPQAYLTLHRTFTHSFAGVAVVAPLLALLLWRLGRDKRYARVAGLLAAGMLWHILWDLPTALGTVVLYPFSRHRFSWDLLAHLDLMPPAILLAVLLAMKLYETRDRYLPRLALAWAVPLCLMGWLVERISEGPFNRQFLVLACGILSVGLLAPAIRGWGFRWNTVAWSRAGIVLVLAYLGLCAVAHWLVVRQVSGFALENRLRPKALAALPGWKPPLEWSGLLQTSEGVFQSDIRLFAGSQPRFRFLPDAFANPWVVRSRALPMVQTYLWGARFPVSSYRAESPRHIVTYRDFGHPQRADLRIAYVENGDLLEAGFIEAP